MDRWMKLLITACLALVLAYGLLGLPKQIWNLRIQRGIEATYRSEQADLTSRAKAAKAAAKKQAEVEELDATWDVEKVAFDATWDIEEERLTTQRQTESNKLVARWQSTWDEIQYPLDDVEYDRYQQLQSDQWDDFRASWDSIYADFEARRADALSIVQLDWACKNIADPKGIGDGLGDCG